MKKWGAKQTPETRISYKFKNCYDIFKTEMMEDIETSKACLIHDAFEGNGITNHNCIGCNLNDSTMVIFNFLKSYSRHKSIQNDIPVYILLLYLLVERIEVFFDIIELPLAYRSRHFNVFKRVRKWANFIKHPKAFILTHHAGYNFINSQINLTNKFDLTIDEKFVLEHYSGPDGTTPVKGKLYEALRNKKHVVVMFPDIVQLTKDFAIAYNKMLNVILKNEVYIEILGDKATYKDYFNEN